MRVKFRLCQTPEPIRHYLLYQFESGWTMDECYAALAQGRAAIMQLPDDELVDSIFCLPPDERFNFKNLLIDVRQITADPINERIRCTYIVGLQDFARVFVTLLVNAAQKLMPNTPIRYAFCATLEDALACIQSQD